MVKEALVIAAATLLFAGSFVVFSTRSASHTNAQAPAANSPLAAKELPREWRGHRKAYTFDHMYMERDRRERTLGLGR